MEEEVCTKAGKNLVYSLQGKTVKGGRRKGGESANLGEVSSRLAGHNEEFLLCFKAKRSHWKI